MNFKKFFKVSLAAILGIGVCLNNGVNNVYAGKNDSDSDTPAMKYDSTYNVSYYNDIKGTKGDTLLEGLASISIDNHKYFTSYNNLRGALAYSDEDLNDSSKVIDFYTGWSLSNEWGSGGSNWNREHVWAQSLSGNTYGTSGAGSDIHHIRPEVPGINSARGNNLFADINSNTTYKYNNKDTGCYLSGGYFEPRDGAKGDVARILMYLYMHYSKEVSANSSFSYAGALDITNIVYTSSGTDQAAWNLLMSWNDLDPVDDWENNRHDYCVKFTGVRNPFIDHPEFARMIWDSSYSGNGAINDTNSGGGSSSPVEEYLNLVDSSLTLNEGETYTLKYSTNITNKTVTFTSSNTNVATVSSSGVITAKSAGQTTIKVSCNGLEDSLILTVNKVDTGDDNNDNSENVSEATAVYKVTSKNAVSSTNTPNGSSATYSQTYSTTSQITSNNSATLTLNGYDGLTIKGIILSMKSNSSKGAGSLSITSSKGTTIASISSKNFSDPSWNGSYTTSYVPVEVDMDEYKVLDNDVITILISASVNSLYIESYSITYAKAEESIKETLSLDKETLSLNAGDTYTLSPITNIKNPNYTFSSSNTSVATISSSGVITAVKKGSSIISVSCNNLTASLLLTVTDDVEDAKESLREIDTKAQLDFGYTYTKEGSSATAVLDYVSSTAATNMKADQESSNLFGLDSSIFSVYGSKTTNNQNNVGLGANGGTIRLYDSGNTFSVTCVNKINYIEIGGLNSRYSIDNVQLLVNGKEVAYTLNNDKYHYEINANSFELTTNTTKKRFEFSTIDINYGEETINYTYFGNVNVRYSATVPSNLMGYVDSYGINFKMGNQSKDYELNNAVENGSETSFAVVLKNITDYKSVISVTAYVYVDGERIDFSTKSYSILDMVKIYIKDSSKLELTQDQINALVAFENYIEG